MDTSFTSGTSRNGTDDNISDIESDDGFNSDDTNIEPIPDISGLTSGEEGDEIQSSDSSDDDEDALFEREDISSKCVAEATKEKGYPIKSFLPAAEIVHLLVNVGDKHTVDSIPDGRKENIYYILSDESNRLRCDSGKKKIYPDDCGVWNTSKGKVVKTYFVLDGDNGLKFVNLREGRYCSLKRQSGTKVYEEIEPQPSEENLVIMTRYYTTLKPDDNYKRRVSRLELSSNKQSSYAIVEYIGKYPEEIVPHGNSKHQDTMYTRTNPEILAKRVTDGLLEIYIKQWCWMIR